MVTDRDHRQPSLPHPIFIHRDLLDTLQNQDAWTRRLGIILRQIAAGRRPNQIKSCRDPRNSGWLRTPVAGMHYYLWWSNHASNQVAALNPSSNEIFLRTIRHHDDHTPLHCGRRDEYVEVFVQHLINERIPFEEDLLETSPWTPEQQGFIQAYDSVRIVLGKPGSGKTACLWRAVERHPAQRLLYLTWSKELARQAQSHFAALAPGRAITCWHFTRLLRELTDQDEPNLTLAESRRRFRSALDYLGAHQLGPWRGHLSTLHAELRAFLIGRARPGHPSTVFNGFLYHLQKETYLEERRSDRSNQALNTAWHVFQLLHRKEQLTGIFPELVVASRAIRRLDAEPFPEHLRTFEGIVVDEVQDLTLLEFTLVLSLWHALATLHHTTPLLLLAGDEGQTVRPTGFRWGPYKSWMTESPFGVHMNPPRDFVLAASLRCPTNIANTFDRAARYYRHLNRDERPARQHRDTPATGGGRLLYVKAGNADEARDLIQELSDQETTIVVSLEDDVSGDIWTPASVKGLERQNVVVLNPGEVLEKLEQPVENIAFDREDYRNQIDRFRVVLSRACETLVFLDIAPSEQQQNYCKEILGPDAEEIPPSELPDTLHQGDLSTLERIEARLEEFRARIDEDPLHGFRLALRAWELFHQARTDEDGPADVARDVRLALLRSLARLLTGDFPAFELDEDHCQHAEQAAGELGPDHQVALRELIVWSRSGRTCPANLLEAASRLREPTDWLQEALSAITHSLITALEEGARRPASAGAFAGDVASWLRFIDYRGNSEAEARRLRCIAFDTLLERRNLDEAQRVLDRIEPEDLLRQGRLLEAQGEYERALELYRQAGADADVRRLIPKIFHFSNNALRVFRRLAEACTSPDQIPDLISSVSGSLQEPLPELGDRYLRMLFGSQEDAQESLAAFHDYLTTVHRHADALEDPVVMILGGLEALTRSGHASAGQTTRLLFEHYGTRELARSLLASPLGKYPECAEPAILFLAGQALQTLRHCTPYQNLKQLLDHEQPSRALPDG